MFARQRGVEILVENILNDLSTPKRLLEFFEHSHMRDLKVCFDAGNAHLDGGVDDALELLRGRIASTHLHDNAGAKDEHLLPGEGKVPWERVVRNLRQQSSDLCFLLELRGGEGGSVNLGKAAEAASRLERMLEEPSS